MSFLAVPQRAVSYRAPSLPSSLAASCILWRMWRKTERWCSAARPREAHLPCTGECVTAVLYRSLPPLPVDAACFYTGDSLNIFQIFDIMSLANVSILSSAVPRCILAAENATERGLWQNLNVHKSCSTLAFLYRTVT